MPRMPLLMQREQRHEKFHVRGINDTLGAIYLLNHSAAEKLNLLSLKRQCHEIFLTSFFSQSITPRHQINTLRCFRILFRIRRDIRL
jgi:hypothetical protein